MATITRTAGIAGQYGFTVTEEDGGRIEFVGSVYGSPGPVVAIMGGMQTFVSDPGRFGPTFNRAWVEAFVNGADHE